MSFISQLIEDCIEQFNSNPYGFPANAVSVLKLFYWHAIAKKLYPQFVGSHDGMKFFYDTSSDGCAITYYRPYLEYPLFWFVKNYVRKNDIVVDVGSNIGNYTMLCARNEAYVFAFEPNEKAVQLCKINIILNNFQNVTVNSVALSDRKGVSQFFLQSIGKSGISSMLSSSRGAKKVLIKTDTLDRFSKENALSAINFLKIDVEGAEALVFSGAKKLLKDKKIEVIAWETNSQYKNRQTDKILLQLSRYGYKTVYFDEQNNTIRDWNNDSIAFSYLPSNRTQKIFEKWTKNRVEI